MLKVFDLIKIYFKEMFTRRKKKENKISYAWILVGLLVLIYGAFFVTTFTRMIELSYTNNGINDMCLYPLVGIVSFSSLIFAFLAGNKLSLTKKDIAILVPLPIGEKTIVRSKLVFAIIIESIFSVFLGIVYLIAYIIMGHATFTGIVTIIVVTILSNILPVATVSVIMLLIHNAISKSKYAYKLAKIEQVLLIFFVVVISASFSLIMNLGATGEDTSNRIFVLYEAIITYYPFLWFIKMGIHTSNILYVLAYVLIHIVIGFVFYLVFTKKCYKLMLNDADYAKDNSVSKIEYNKNSFKKTLFKRELKVFTSHSIITSNSLVGPIMMILMLILFFFVMPKEEMTVVLDFMVPFFILFVVTMTYTPSFTPSIDIKYSWILRTLPVKDEDIFKVKIKFNMLLALIPSLIMSLITFIYYLINNQFNLAPIYLFLLAIPFSYEISLMMLLTGLKFPDYSDDIMHKVKQSKAVGLGILFAFGLMIPEMIFALVLPIFISLELSYLIGIVFTFLIALLFRKALYTKGLKYYANFY